MLNNSSNRQGQTQGVTVIIPAFNEQYRIRDTVSRLESFFSDGRKRALIVVANGCTDQTFSKAQDAGKHYTNILVIETPYPSKREAINIGIREAPYSNIIVLDADVQIGLSDIEDLAVALEEEDQPCIASPALRVDYSRSPAIIRSYYRYWTASEYSRLQVGSGCYGINAAGLERIVELPPVINDDGWVMSRFEPSERKRTSGEFTVIAPRRVSALVRRKARIDIGNRQLDRDRGGRPVRTKLTKRIVGTHNSQLSPLDVFCFFSLSLAAKSVAAYRRMRGTTTAWATDSSTRVWQR